MRGRAWDDVFELLQNIVDGKEPKLYFFKSMLMDEIADVISAALDDKIDPDADEDGLLPD